MKVIALGQFHGQNIYINGKFINLDQHLIVCNLNLERSEGWHESVGGCNE